MSKNTFIFLFSNIILCIDKIKFSLNNSIQTFWFVLNRGNLQLDLKSRMCQEWQILIWFRRIMLRLMWPSFVSINICKLWWWEVDVGTRRRPGKVAVSTKLILTLYKHPVERCEMKEPGQDPAGAVHMVKYRHRHITW